jgi:hypothetical protein
MLRQPNENCVNYVRHKIQHHFNVVLPESYQSMLQTIITSEQASKLSGLQLRIIKADNLIAFILEEAQHCIIDVMLS